MEGREEPAEIDQHVLEEGHGETVGQIGRHTVLDHQHGDYGNRDLSEQLDLAGKALGVAFGQLQEVVGETKQAKTAGNQQNRPDEAVAEIGPEQGGNRKGDQDQQPAHGRCALFGHQMAFRAILADRLALALLAAQPVDQPGAEHEADQQGSHDRAAGPEGEIPEQVEDLIFVGERDEQVIQHGVPLASVSRCGRR